MLKRLWHLIGGVPREEWGGLMLSDHEARPVRYSGDHRRLLHAVSETLPSDAILYLESPDKLEIRHFLGANPAETTRKIAVGTLWPRDVAFHLRNERALLQRLMQLAENVATPELADHLIVYRGDEVLVSAYDLGERELWLSRRLSDEVVGPFLETLGGTEVGGADSSTGAPESETSA